MSIHALQIGKSWLPEEGGNGLDRVYDSICQHLPDAGVEVSGLVAGSEQVERQSGYARAFAPSQTPLLQRLYRARKVGWDLYDERHVDLVACHFALYGLPLLDLLHRAPTVIHFHGPWSAESLAEGENVLKAQVKAFLERCTYHSGQRFIVLSRAFRQLLTSRHGVPEHQIRVVPGGVDASRFDVGVSPSTARQRLEWPTDRPIILSVRRLARRMGLSNLVAAMDTVSERHPDALLLIAGKGPLRTELSSLIRSKNLEQHVRLLGFVPDDDLPFAYRAADLSIVPTTKHEGFGLITIESLAAGTPVLVTPVGGLPETVSGLSDDLVLPDASTESLRDALTCALDGALPLPNPQRCQEYARAQFDWPVIARRVRSVYEEVL